MAPDSNARVQITVAVIGLAGVLGAALLTNWKNIFPDHSGKTGTPVEMGKDTSSAGAPVKPKEVNKGPGKEPGQDEPAHTMIRKDAFRVPMTGKMHFYDFDSGEDLADASPAADFQFKSGANPGPNTSISVMSRNGAVYFPTSSGLLPWMVPQSAFRVGMGDDYSVPQNHPIPCVTNSGNFCSFVLRIEQGELIVAYAVYRR